jgi:hypothetical protein
MHGGPTPSGIASPHFKTGEHSQVLKHLPPAWAPHFDATNPDAERLTNELHVLDAAIVDVYERMKAGKKITAVLKRELADLYDRKGRLVAIDSRRRKDEHEMVSRDRFGEFARAFLQVLVLHISDRQLLGKIQADALRVLAISQVPLVTEAAS